MPIMMGDPKPLSATETREQLRAKKLSIIEPIGDWHEHPERKEDLAKLVEGPLLSTCEILYDKNIETFMSSANKQNIAQGYVDFQILVDSLSKRNKMIADDLVKEGLAKLRAANAVDSSLLSCYIPVTADSVWGEIEDAGERIANRFVQQTLVAEVYTPQYLMEYLAAALEDVKGDITPEDIEKHGYAYDPESGYFFKSKEDLRRASQPIEGEDPKRPKTFLKIIKSKLDELDEAETKD